VTILATVVVAALWVFVALMVVRLIIGWTMMFARNWRPTGAIAAVLEVAFSATDPPLRALRRVIPPLRLGSFALDLAFIVVFAVALALINVVSPYTS
jgi:YggT family protein